MTKSTFSRRTVLKGIGALAGAGAVGAGVVHFSTESAVAASFAATDASATTDDGTITQVTVEPTLTVEWDGLDTSPQEIDVTVTASGENDGTLHGNRKMAETVSLSDRGTSGSKSVTMSAYNLVSPPPDGPFDPADFEAAADGGSVTRTVTLAGTVEVTDGTKPLTSDDIEAVTFDVTVNNQPSTASASGTANTDVG